jgi:zinc D-Ala-D-Ala carboxypeptidase
MRYFKLKEFDSRDKPGSGQLMDPYFLQLLDKARTHAQIPFRISSGYRTKEHNKKVGGVPNSAHLKGLAADIVCNNSSDRYIILSALLHVGFHRIGVGDSFIHCDTSTEKPGFMVWTY